MTPTTSELTTPLDAVWTTGRSPTRQIQGKTKAVPGHGTTLRGLLLTPGREALGLRFGAIAALALLVLMFWENIVHFVLTWYTDANYSHGFLVPLISLYFASEAARLGPVRVAGGLGEGMLLVLGAILGRLVTLVIPVGMVGDLSFLLGLAGLTAMFAGREALRRFGFVLAFLVFMIPLPIALYTAIASPLQLLVSRVAAGLLNVMGTPVLCQGNLMTLPGGVRMFVAEACSGMRQLTGFLALTTAVAYLSARPAWYRAVVIASSVPIAMTANIIRVVLTGLIMYHIDPAYASGSLHTLEGLIMMGLGLALLAALCAALNWAIPPVKSVPVREEPTLEPIAPGQSQAQRRWAPRLVLGVGLLLVGLVGQEVVEAATATTRPSLNQPLANLPPRIGNWIGRDIPVDPKILAESQCDDYLNRVYDDPRYPGHSLSLWMNYSKTGLNLRHSPEVCLPSGGWEKVESQTYTLDIDRPSEDDVRVTRLAYRQGELVQGVGFWYYIFGEGPVSRYVRGLPITSRSSHGRTTRGSGLTIEVFCPGEIDPDGEMLRGFVTALLDELEPTLPADRAAYFRP